MQQLPAEAEQVVMMVAPPPLWTCHHKHWPAAAGLIVTPPRGYNKMAFEKDPTQYLLRLAAVGVQLQQQQHPRKQQLQRQSVAVVVVVVVVKGR